MNGAIAWRLAARELRGGLRGFRIFLACLALGVAAIAAVGTVRAAITAGLSAEGAKLLGGDAEVTLTYRFASDAEREWMDSIASRVSETVDFRSMAVVDRDVPERALTQVRAVDDLYPLIGEVELTPDIGLPQAFAGRDGLPSGVMQPVLADRLGLVPGDVFRLGQQEFVLMAVLNSYPDDGGGGFALGPRSLVLLDDLQHSGLIREGTLFDTNYRLDLPEGAILSDLSQEADILFRNSGLRWRDARDGAGGVGRFVDRIGAFLILIGLSGLAVGGVGVSAAVRSYLSEKTAVIATLKTLGATRSIIFQTYFIQIGVLTLLGVAIGIILGVGIPVGGAPLITAQLPVPAIFAIYPGVVVEASVYGLLAALIFTLWPIAQSQNIRAAALFRGDNGALRGHPGWAYVVAMIGLIAGLIGAAIWFSGTVFLTLWTAGGITAALGLLWFAAAGMRRIAGLGAARIRRWPALRWALASIRTARGETLSVVLSLGLGLSVLATVGQIEANMRRAISDQLPDIAPSYFFVDIQPDQIEGFQTTLAEYDMVSRVDAVPMLRGIITQINGRPANEVAGDHWVIQGDRGVTYAGEMPENTELVRGDWWGADYSGPPVISFAREEAEEMGLQIGDELTVNILGRDITARIMNFQEVSFENVGIGFILTMNAGALAGAPHSWISTVYTDQASEAQILRDLAQQYPNITAIRVRDGIDRVVEILSGIATATRYGAAATLLTGFLVLIGAAAAGSRARAFESGVLKTLGASRRRIMISFALRSVLLGMAAGIVAIGAGWLGGWAVIRFIMDSDFAFDFGSSATIIACGVAAVLLSNLVFARRALSARPARVLRGRE